MRINSRKAIWSTMLGALGAAVLLSAAPSASADPVAPAPPAPVVPVPGPAPVLPAPEPLADPALGDQPGVVAAVSHLPSPENLPPGATLDPGAANQGRGVSYLRELWHAVQTQEVSKSGALLLLTQRPMNPDTAPPAGMPVGPQAPVPPAPVLPAALPAPPAAP